MAKAIYAVLFKKSNSHTPKQVNGALRSVEYQVIYGWNKASKRYYTGIPYYCRSLVQKHHQPVKIRWNDRDLGSEEPHITLCVCIRQS